MTAETQQQPDSQQPQVPPAPGGGAQPQSQPQPQPQPQYRPQPPFQPEQRPPYPPTPSQGCPQQGPAPQPPYAAQPPYPPQAGQPPRRRQQPVNGFTIAGMALAVIALIASMWAFGDFVNVYGIVGLALGIIGWFYTKDYAEAHGEKPSNFNKAVVVVVILFSIIAIVMTPISTYLNMSWSVLY